MYPSRPISRAAPTPTPAQAADVARVVASQTNGGTEDVMVLQRWNGKLIAEEFHLPDMEVEIERAVEQVEGAIKAKDKLVAEKMELEKATVGEGLTAKDVLPREVVAPLEEKERRIHEEAGKIAGEEGAVGKKAKE